MNAIDVLNMVRVHRDHVAARASTQEARGDRYGDHDAWSKARELNGQVRELDALVRDIERSIEAPGSAVATGLAWAHRLVSDAIGAETDARKRQGLADAAALIARASEAMAR